MKVSFDIKVEVTETREYEDINPEDFLSKTGIKLTDAGPHDVANYAVSNGVQYDITDKWFHDEIADVESMTFED